MIYFVYFNLDGYITQIGDFITSTFEDMEISYKAVYIGNLSDSVFKDNPEMMILFHPSYDWDKYFPLLSSISCHKILWDLESPFEIDVIRKGLDQVLYLLIMDKNSTEFLKSETKGKEIHFVPCSCYPERHGRIKDVPWQYRSDLCFVGAPFKSRIAFFDSIKEELEDYFLTIIGYDWRNVIDWKNQHIIRDILLVDEITKYYSGAKIALNLQRTNKDSYGHNENNIEPSSPANRLFEIACSGTCQMVDKSRVPEIFEYFNEDEIVIFNGPEDFLDKFKYLLSHKDKREAIGRKAMKKVIECYTYRHTIEKHIFNLIK